MFGLGLFIIILSAIFIESCASKKKIDKDKIKATDETFRIGNPKKVLSAIRNFIKHGITTEQLDAFSKWFDAVDYSHTELIRFCDESAPIPELHHFFLDVLYDYEAREVFADMRKNKLDSLLIDYGKCVNFKDTIKGFFNAVDCDDYTYNQLDCYYHLNNFVDLMPVFDSLVKTKKSDIYDELSEMSMQEMAEYYNENKSDISFLKNTIEESVLGDLEEEDFRFVSQAHKCFRNTDLSERIDSIYTNRRMELLPVVTKSVNDVFIFEKDMLQYMCEDAKNNIAKYIEEKADIIVEKCNERMDYGFLKESKEQGLGQAVANYMGGELYEYTDFVNKTVSKELSATEINQMINSKLLEFVSFSNETRSKLVDNLFFDPIDFPSNDLAELACYSVEQINADGNSIESIEHIKNRNSDIDYYSNCLDLTLGALELNPVVAGVMAVIGMGSGIFISVREAKQTQRYLAEFKSKLVEDVIRFYDKKIEDKFLQLDSINSVSQKQFKNIVYENF